MFTSKEEEQISLSVAYGDESINGSPQLGSSLEMVDLQQQNSAFLANLTDVNDVQVHEKDQLEQKIMNLEEEIANLRLKERSLDEKRRAALNKTLDIKGCIRVFCRVRPFLSTDKRRIRQPISVESDKIVLKSGGSRKEFAFDKVFHQEASQEQVFIEVEPVLRSALDGHNACILSYGQTGTGKTFTMEGTTDSPGIIPHALEELFQKTSSSSSTSYTFSISMLEVYLGSLKDLLAARPSSKTYSVSRCNLNIQTDSKGSVDIEGLTEVPVSNFVKANWWYNKGRRIRSTSWTNVNEISSRSHCLTRIIIYRQENASESKALVSKLWMVDLGGSERLFKTGATGQTMDEGRAINLSLSALGDVIAALRRKRGHVPYRNSKLTQILRDSLGGGSKVMMLVHVSPYEEDVGETTCSFTFAKRARAVECHRELSDEMKKQKEKTIAALEEEMKRAEEECQELRTQIQKAELLLFENKKLLMRNDPLHGDEEKSLSGPEQDPREEALETPKMSDSKTKRNGGNVLPRFMNPTVASNLRRSAAEKANDRKVKSVKSWNRSSIQVPGSQSVSYSDPRFKALLKNSKKNIKSRDPNIPLIEDPKSAGLDSKPSKAKIVTSSDPLVRVAYGHHRRRMSDLI
ncbi:microtubule binding motor protein [Lithospermum erythrorhizon]|uniref:Microtubule binding motor protein n=1 Tax=Lithospermum erythrorhizon TaxID=34254 RepID=A0AAV3PW11_LITER